MTPPGGRGSYTHVHENVGDRLGLRKFFNKGKGVALGANERFNNGRRLSLISRLSVTLPTHF